MGQADLFKPRFPTAVTDSSAQEINILLLGATGVGKSTFINALYNYLSFSTLGEARDAALQGEIRSLIYSEFFSSTEDDDEERKIVVGKADPDEGGKSVGSSCTQKCNAYSFNVGETLIRLINTPGIDDTRGFHQDVENFKGTLSYISGYEKLNAICILLKPNEERLTTSLKYCIVELLSHHKDATANILFCFTNARSTMFRAGGTCGLLQIFLDESPQTASIKLDKSTIYHFDSEGFRYLACVANGLKFSDCETDVYSQSWNQSTNEAWRLIAHISPLEAHVVERTLWSPTAVTDSSAQEINILLLGATGIGKSTFINALYNYRSFPTLHEARDAALKGEIRSLIYSEFVEDDDEERKIVVGKADPDEGRSAGRSCTQRCKEHTFNVGETLIRLIDTPGIGYTRGFHQDVENFKGILSYISGYEKLNAICILLKPNERLTTSLKYCIVELLSHLHKDAAANILFCFTNARSTRFRAGRTYELLQTLLKESPQTASIKLDKKTMYHFDSEGFRYLACVANGLKFSDCDTDVVSQSWNQSTKEAWRLIDYISSLEAHVVESTVSLNRLRVLLAAIETPLAEISKIILGINLDGVGRITEEVLQSHGSITDLTASLIIKESVQETVALGHFRTICRTSKCKDVICHDHCSPHETILGMFASIKDYFLAPVQPSLFCSQLSKFSGECRECKCPNGNHTRVSTEIRTVVREREDEDIRRETQGEIQKKQEMSEILKKRAKSIKEELEVVMEDTAIFAGYLSDNSIITYHSATQDYLKDEIKKTKRSEDCSTPEGRARIEELEYLLENYEKEVEHFKERSSGKLVKKLTTEDVKGELEKFYNTIFVKGELENFYNTIFV